MGVDTSFTGAAGPAYPNMTGPPVYSNIRRSFGAAPFGQLGQLARNTFHGPGINNFDLAILKNVRIAEGMRAQLRGELFNAFNHAQFAFGGAALASSIAAPQPGSMQPRIAFIDPSMFGRVGARPQRIVQLGLKLRW